MRSRSLDYASVMVKAPTQHGPPKPDPMNLDAVLARAQTLLALDPISQDGARKLGRQRGEIVETVDLLAAGELAEEACELGLLLEQAMEQLGEAPGPREQDGGTDRNDDPSRSRLALDDPNRSRFALIEHLLGIARVAGHAYYEGELLLRQAELWLAAGQREQAETGYAAAQGLAQRESIGVIEVAALAGLAELARRDGNLFKAHLLFTKQEALARSLGEALLQSQALTNLSATALAMGDHRRGARYARENLALCRAEGDEQGTAEALCSLGMAQRHLGEPTESRRCYKDALTLSRRLENEGLEAAVCYNFGCLLAETEPKLAAGLLHHAQVLAQRIGAPSVKEASARAASEIAQRLSPGDLRAARDDAARAIQGLLAEGPR